MSIWLTNLIDSHEYKKFYDDKYNNSLAVSRSSKNTESSKENNIRSHMPTVVEAPDEDEQD